MPLDPEQSGVGVPLVGAERPGSLVGDGAGVGVGVATLLAFWTAAVGVGVGVGVGAATLAPLARWYQEVCARADAPPPASGLMA
jgi:hypothetical protein